MDLRHVNVGLGFLDAGLLLRAGFNFVAIHALGCNGSARVRQVGLVLCDALTQKVSLAARILVCH